MPDNQINELNQNIEKLNTRMNSPLLAFSKGILTGFGSVLGAGLAIILIGWFLNVIGVIPAFQKQAQEWRDVFIQKETTDYVAPDVSNNSGQ